MADRQISTQATERIRAQILDGTLAPGSRLPSERVLSAELGISRTALRDALQTLEATGFVEVHGGRGRFVSDSVSGQGSAAALSWLFVHRNSLESLNEVRSLIEPRAVETMSSSKTAEITARASAIVEQQVQAIVAGEFRSAAELDNDFHLALVSGTPNLPLLELAEQLINMARVHAPRTYEAPVVAAQSVAEHESILDALHAGDTATAATLVDQTLRAYRRAGNSSTPQP